MNDEARPMRADARRNRARVLEAAEAILARDGLSASMRAVADHAGVGLGTIYRQFPNREALYLAVIGERMRRLYAEARELLDADDPGAAFFGFFTRVVEVSTRKKALADVLADAGIDPKAGIGEQVDADMPRVIEELLIRAQRVGAVRADLAMPELRALLSAVSMAAERQQWDEQLRTRTLGMLFDGLRAHH
jgi:AcrR family transcriptional regulator